jgi:hypothetical protein
MKTNEKTLAIIAAVLIVGFVLMSNSIQVPFAAGSACQFAKPYFGSIRCEKEGSSSQTQPIENDQVFSMVTGDTAYSDYNDAIFLGFANANVGQVTCGPTYLKYYIYLQDKSPIDTTWHNKYTCSCNRVENVLGICADCTNAFQQFKLDTSREYRMHAECSYLTTTEKATSSTVSWKVQFYKENFYKYYDNVRSLITGTVNCKYNEINAQFMSQYSNKQPASQTAWNTLISKLSAILKITGKLQPDFDFTANELPVDSYAGGDSYIYVDSWVPAIADLNLYKYNNQDVYCYNDGNTKSLYSLTDIKTNNPNVCYSIPGSSVASVECCDQSDCLKLGSGYSCDNKGISGAGATFKCVKTETKQCSTAFDCGSGQSVCNKETDGKYYKTTAGDCVNGMCQKPAKTEVKCCTQYCAGGTWCDQSIGCVNSKSQCPTGNWCSDDTSCPYFSRPCGTGLTACPSSDKCTGSCQTSCQAVSGCTSDSMCNDGNAKTDDTCVKDFWGKGSCSNVIATEKGCFETCGVTNVGCVADCYAKQGIDKVFSAMQSGVKFLLALFMMIATTLFMDQSLKNSFSKKNIWKRPLVSLALGIIVFIVIIML